MIAGDNQKGIARLNADGSLDTAFAARQGADSSSITSFLIQPDQKILVCGGFSSFSGKAVTGLIRLMPDGTIDPSFN